MYNSGVTHTILNSYGHRSHSSDSGSSRRNSNGIIQKSSTLTKEDLLDINSYTSPFDCFLSKMIAYKLVNGKDKVGTLTNKAYLSISRLSNEVKTVQQQRAKLYFDNLIAISPKSEALYSEYKATSEELANLGGHSYKVKEQPDYLDYDKTSVLVSSSNSNSGLEQTFITRHPIINGVIIPKNVYFEGTNPFDFVLKDYIKQNPTAKEDYEKALKIYEKLERSPLTKILQTKQIALEDAKYDMEKKQEIFNKQQELKADAEHFANLTDDQRQVFTKLFNVNEQLYELGNAINSNSLNYNLLTTISTSDRKSQQELFSGLCKDAKSKISKLDERNINAFIDEIATEIASTKVKDLNDNYGSERTKIDTSDIASAYILLDCCYDIQELANQKIIDGKFEKAVLEEDKIIDINAYRKIKEANLSTETDLYDEIEDNSNPVDETPDNDM